MNGVPHTDTVVEGNSPFYISWGMEKSFIYKGAELINETSRKNRIYIIGEKIKEKENMEKGEKRFENRETRAEERGEREGEGELQLGTRRSYIEAVVEQVVSVQREEQKRRREYRRRRKEVEKWRKGEEEEEGVSCHSQDKA